MTGGGTDDGCGDGADGFSVDVLSITIAGYRKL